MNFGHKIAAGYSFFVLFIVGMVIMTFKTSFSLETEDYYEKELKYSEEQEAEQNYLDLVEPIRFKNSADFFEIQLGEKITCCTDSVSIQFVRPSDVQLDWHLIQKADSIVKLGYDQLQTGIYKLEVHWEIDGKDYLMKEKVYVQAK